MLERLKRVEFETTFGPIVVWEIVSAFALVCSALEGVVWTFLGWIVDGLWILASFVGFVAFVNALVSGRLGRAFAQLVLGVAGFIVLGVCVSFVNTLVWRTSESTEQVPFSVAYRTSYLFLAEYDKRIVFRSGKSIGVWPDTGGAGSFAVYALDSGVYYLADGLDCDFMRNDYRVDVQAETVEMNVDGFWVKIPEGTLSVDGKGLQFLSVKTPEGTKTVRVANACPVGMSLEGRVFLGFIRPSGKFVASSDDPFAGEMGKLRMGLEANWRPCGVTNAVPFEVDDGKRLNLHSRRIRLKSGKTLEILHDVWNLAQMKIFMLGPDEYELVDSTKSWGGCSYRVNVSNETIDVEYDDHWLRLPEGALSVMSMGKGWNKDGTVTWRIEVMTANGSVEGHESVPVGDSKKQRRYICTIRP